MVAEELNGKLLLQRQMWSLLGSVTNPRLWSFGICLGQERARQLQVEVQYLECKQEMLNS